MEHCACESVRKWNCSDKNTEKLFLNLVHGTYIWQAVHSKIKDSVSPAQILLYYVSFDLIHIICRLHFWNFVKE